MRLFRMMVVLALFSFVAMGVPTDALAAGDHPGDEVKEGEEHPGDDVKVGGKDIKKAIKRYVEKDVLLKGGYFFIWDDKLGKNWRLKFSRFHDPARHMLKKDTYFMCTDFKSVDDGTVLDIDLWVKKKKDGHLKVTEIKIHKVDGKERYTFKLDEIVDVK